METSLVRVSLILCVQDGKLFIGRSLLHGWLRPTVGNLKLNALQREVLHDAVPILWHTTFVHDQQFFDSLAYRHSFGDYEQSRHKQICHNAVKGKIGHRRDVVSQYDSTVVRRPFENDGVFRAHQWQILNAHYIDARSQHVQAANDIPMKVFI